MRGATRRRHADAALRMAQTPTTASLKSTEPPPRPGRSTDWREKIRPAQPLQRLYREKTRPASAKTPNLGCFECAGRTYSHFRDDTAPPGELFRACRRRPSSVLPISDQAPPVWRVPEGPGGPARGAVGDHRAWSRQISHVISDGHFLRPPKNVAIPTR